MKYYSLTHNLDRKVIGSYPQSEKMADHYFYKNADSIWNLHYDSDFTPNLDAIQLCRGVKLTDMLSVVAISDGVGKLISGRFKELLHDFHLPSLHRFFEAKVLNYRKREVKEKQYYLFRVLEHQNQYIDFDRSEFYVRELGGRDLGTIEIQKWQDLEYSAKDRGLGVGQLVEARFITLFPEVNYDIFSFRRFAGYFVSERLKTTIEEEGLTGIRFEPADYIIHHEKVYSKAKTG